MNLFEFANERESIRLMRLAGVQEPWTKDEKLRTVHFGNIFREDDPTTQWIKTHMLDRASGLNERCWAACVARMFGTVECLRLIMGMTDVEEMFRTIEPHYQKEWKFTGRYRTKARPTRMGAVRQSLLQLQDQPLGAYVLAQPEAVHKRLIELPAVGPLCANEILSDIDPKVEYLFPHWGIMAGLGSVPKNRYPLEDGNPRVPKAWAALCGILEQSRSEWRYPDRPWTLTTAARAALLYGQYLNEDYSRRRSR